MTAMRPSSRSYTELATSKHVRAAAEVQDSRLTKSFGSVGSVSDVEDQYLYGY